MKLSKSAQAVLTASQRCSNQRRQPFCGAEQLLESVLLELGHVSASRPVTKRLDAERPLPFQPGESEFTRSIMSGVLPAALSIAERDGIAEVSPEYLLAALLDARSPVDEELREQVVQRLKFPIGDHLKAEVPSGDTCRSESSSESLLEPLASRIADDTLVDRDLQLDRIMLTLLYGNPLLVGPVGCGKRSLIRLLVRRLASASCPASLAGTELLALDPTRLLAGTTYRGELEERVQRLLTDLAARPKKPVLVIEDLALLVGAGGTGSGADVAGSLAAALARGELRLLAAVTADAQRERLEKQPGLLSQLTVVNVDPPNAVEACGLLSSLPELLRQTMGVAAAPEIVNTAVSLCQDHLPHLAMPGTAGTLLRGAAATLSFETEMLKVSPQRSDSPYWRFIGNSSSPTILGEQHLLHALSLQHRIPLDHLERGVGDKLTGLETSFKQHIFGQDHVLEVVARTVKVALANLGDGRRPRGRLFFLGPPGTGKSECAKLLARYLMGGEEALLRFDMSEFQEASSVSTLIGSDKGLVGSDEGGRLTEPLRENPHRVILFDEIEKAHPAVFNLFLQLLEYGQLHDKRGRPVGFRHALLIFTSNEGCTSEHGLFGKSRGEIVNKMRAAFRPEFLDRIEEFVPFRALDSDSRAHVAEFQLRKLRDQVLRSHRCDLAWTAPVVARGAWSETGEAGVRHILRWIQAEVKPLVADVLLAAPAGDETRCIELRVADESSGALSAALELRGSQKAADAA